MDNGRRHTQPSSAHCRSSHLSLEDGEAGGKLQLCSVLFHVPGCFAHVYTCIPHVSGAFGGRGLSLEGSGLERGYLIPESGMVDSCVPPCGG